MIEFHTQCVFIKAKQTKKKPLSCIEIMFWYDKTHLIVISYTSVFMCLDDWKSWNWIVTYEQERSLLAITCHQWTLIIPVGSHGQHICSSFAARMCWAEAAYPLITLISALFIHLLPDPSYGQKFFVPENLWFLFFFLYKVLCVHKAMLGRCISFSMPLYQAMTSAHSNCFQTSQGLTFVLFSIS